MIADGASLAFWRASLERRGQDPARWDADPFARPELDETDDVASVCVLAEFDVPSFVDGLVAMLRTSSDDERRRWYRAFTRVVYLAGEPRKLAHRFEPDVTSPTGRIAWYRPRARVGTDPMSRLLTLFSARAPAAAFWTEDTLTHRATDVGLDVRLDVASMSVSECAIHLAHCLAEPWASGCWDASSGVRVRRMPPAADAIATSAYVRLGLDPEGRRVVVGTSHVRGAER